MNYLCPSILAADFWELGKQIALVEKAGVPYWMHKKKVESFYGCAYDGKKARALY